MSHPAIEAVDTPLNANPDVIRIFLVDDHSVVREGLIAILSRERDMEIVGQAEDGASALEGLTEVDADVAIVDYRMSGMDGIALCREIAERRLRARVVVLSAFIEDDAVHASLMAGARAYVVKDVDAEGLKRAIRAVARGETMIDPKVAGRVVGWVERFGSPASGGLRPSEITVLRLLCQGKSNAEIARAAGLSAHTVKSYLDDIYRKLGVGSRTEATAKALRSGLV